MSDLLTRLGLRSTDAITARTLPNYAPHYIIANFVLAHAVFSTRFLKTKYKLDHNVNPREDIATHGERAVRDGKISQAQLGAMKRLQAAHENSLENFPFFAIAQVFASLGGVDAGTVNRYGLIFTAIRIAYVLAYVNITDSNASYLRSLLWWAGNITCFRLVWFAGKALQSKVI